VLLLSLLVLVGCCQLSMVWMPRQQSLYTAPVGMTVWCAGAHRPRSHLLYPGVLSFIHACQDVRCESVALQACDPPCQLLHA
jgi:hypothetical protein